jgi:membrane associated rhomboid family serine protease
VLKPGIDRNGGRQNGRHGSVRRCVGTPRAGALVTAGIIVVNVVVFVLELMRGDGFVTQWAAVPAQIVSGHHWITILTAMFMHGSWSHIIGNMIFLWAFAPEIKDAMGRGRYLVFYLVGGLVAMLAQVAASPHSTIPNLGASGAIAALMGAFIITYPRDQIRTLLFIFVFARIRFIPAALLIGLWFFGLSVSSSTPVLWRRCRPAGWHTWRISVASSLEPPLRACSRVSVESRESLAVT